MKKVILSIFLCLSFFNASILLAQNKTPNAKLVKANEKIAYYIKKSPYEYEEVKKLHYNLPWSDYENLNAFEIKEIKRFLDDNKKMKGQNVFYLVFSIIYKEYERGKLPKRVE